LRAEPTNIMAELLIYTRAERTPTNSLVLVRSSAAFT